MTTVQNVLDYLETIAPQSMKMSWDHIGLQCGSRNAEVKKILVALDPFEHVCQEAVDTKADLLITHHPLIFHPLETLTDDYASTRGIMLLCSNHISSIHAHTNLDCAPGGVNDVLAQLLELSDIQVARPYGADAQGNPYGLLRCGTVQEQDLQVFLAHVKEKLGCPVLRYVDAGKPVHKVAVGGGSCASEKWEALEAGCDTFVTADVKYNDFWDAKERGLNIIDAGHYYTENPVCTYLTEKLQAAFPDIQVNIAKNHVDCMKFF